MQFAAYYLMQRDVKAERRRRGLLKACHSLHMFRHNSHVHFMCGHSGWVTGRRVTGLRVHTSTYCIIIIIIIILRASRMRSGCDAERWWHNGTGGGGPRVNESPHKELRWNAVVESFHMCCICAGLCSGIIRCNDKFINKDHILLLASHRLLLHWPTASDTMMQHMWYKFLQRDEPEHEFERFPVSVLHTCLHNSLLSLQTATSNDFFPGYRPWTAAAGNNTVTLKH